MSARLRRIIGLIFLAGFAVTAPLVILTTKGYRYNWSKGRPEKTGILVLDSKPIGARIYVNGMLQAKTTPASLFRLLPEDYAVRLEKTGYLSWQKVLRVKSGETTFTKEVILFRDAVPKLLKSADIEKAVFGADGRLTAVLNRGDEWLELEIYDRSLPATTLLARFSRDKYAETDISWSPDGDRLLFQGRPADGDAPELYVYPATADLETGGRQISVPEDGRLTAAWSSDGAKIIAVTDHGAYAVDPATGEAAVLTLSSRLQDAAAVGRDAYLLKTGADETVLERTAVDGLGPLEMLAELPPGQYVFTDAGDTYLILTEMSGQSRLVERGTGRIAAVFNASHVSWEGPDGGGRLLLWNDFEIAVLDPSATAPQIVTRLGTVVTGAAWHPEGGVVVYSTPSSVMAIELDDRGERNNFELTKLTDVGVFAIEPSGKTLLLTGSAGNQRGIFERDL